MPLGYPDTIDPGTEIDASEIQGMFDAIKSFVDGLETGGPATDTSWRMIHELAGAAGAVGLTAQLYVTNNAPSWTSVSTTTSVLQVYLDDADYTLSGETPVLRLRVQLLTNATAPGVSFTVGLHEITAVTGGASALSPTVTATTVTGSTVTFTTPSASTRNQAVTGTFALPSDGYYCFGVTPSGSQAASSYMNISCQLQVKVAA